MPRIRRLNSEKKREVLRELIRQRAWVRSPEGQETISRAAIGARELANKFLDSQRIDIELLRKPIGV